MNENASVTTDEVLVKDQNEPSLSVSSESNDGDEDFVSLSPNFIVGIEHCIGKTEQNVQAQASQFLFKELEIPHHDNEDDVSIVLSEETESKPQNNTEQVDTKTSTTEDTLTTPTIPKEEQPVITEYDKGYNDAESQYKQKLQQAEELAIQTKRSMETILTNINSSLTKLTTSQISNDALADVNKKYTDLLCDIVVEMSQKMMINLPINFVEIVKNALATIFVNGDAKASENPIVVRVKVHPDVLTYCTETLKQGLPEDRFNLLNIVSDSEVHIGECSIDYNDTRFMFDRQMICDNIKQIMGTCLGSGV